MCHHVSCSTAPLICVSNCQENLTVHEEWFNMNHIPVRLEFHRLFRRRDFHRDAMEMPCDLLIVGLQCQQSKAENIFFKKLLTTSISLYSWQSPTKQKISSNTKGVDWWQKDWLHLGPRSDFWRFGQCQAQQRKLKHFRTIPSRSTRNSPKHFAQLAGVFWYDISDWCVWWCFLMVCLTVFVLSLFDVMYVSFLKVSSTFSFDALNPAWVFVQRSGRCRLGSSKRRPVRAGSYHNDVVFVCFS